MMLDVDCYCTQARRIARQLTAYYDRALAPAGLKVTQFSLLRALVRVPNPSMAALAAATGLERTTLVRNLAVLERQGLISPIPAPDQRAPLITLTPQGTASLAAAQPLWEAAQAQARTIVPQAELAPLRALSQSLEALA